MSQQFMLWTVIVLSVTGCSVPTLPPLPPPTAPPVSQDIMSQRQQFTGPLYTIGPNDVLAITVYGHDDLFHRALVRPDGSFEYPLCGTIEAGGRTAKDLQREIAQDIKKFVVDPQVSVTVVEFQSHRVHVLGEVRSPGIYTLKHATTLLEVLAMAGGTSADADTRAILVQSAALRGGGGQKGTVPDTAHMQHVKAITPARLGAEADKVAATAQTSQAQTVGLAGNSQETPVTAALTPNGSDKPSPGGTMQVALEQLIAGSNIQPFWVRHGDVIYVPRAAFFYVSGEVAKPDRYRLERDITVAKALAMAGGSTKYAAPKYVQVRRMVNGERQEFRAGPTDLIQAEDEVIVPKSFF